jgi:hypothetical protein
MINVRHSKSKRLMLLDFVGVIREDDVQKADNEIIEALKNIGRGYTLIEVFRKHPQFGEKVGMAIGKMMALCYDNNRIWRVIRVEETVHADPGVSIFHRTRWKRDVPELEMDSLREAVVVAKEEVLEQGEYGKDQTA